jgi:DNA-binding NarL/FixJ family response regulator
MDYNDKIRIVVVDDHEIMRDGLEILIRRQPYMELIGRAGTGQAAIELVAQLLPDVVLMDYGMPGMDGIEASRIILSRNPDMKILLLSATLPRCSMDKAISAGILGIMLKDSTFDELTAAIRAVSNNETYFCSKIMSAITGSYTSHTRRDRLVDSWTLKDREQEILRHISNGMSSKEIARQINISPKTVDACRRQIMDKLNIDSVAGLVKFAIREGITPL